MATAEENGGADVAGNEGNDAEGKIISLILSCRDMITPISIPITGSSLLQRKNGVLPFQILNKRPTF